MESKFGLIIQLNGVVLVTVLSVFLRRSLKLTALRYWTIAWLSLSFALICLRLAFEYENFSTLLLTYYFLGEYLFGFMLVAGCRNLAEGYELRSRAEFASLPLVAVAILFPLISDDFSEIYHYHSLVLAFFFYWAFMSLARSPIKTFGWRVMRITLLLLAVNLAFSFGLFLLRGVILLDQGMQNLGVIVDIVLEASLGIGTVIVLLEKVLGDYKSANDELVDAHRKLEELANTDALTTAFNRHAFYGFVNKQAAGSNNLGGCVGFFDVDDLKQINDTYGHRAGDLAIRSVVVGIRGVIRAEDLIFRWGGDEFFVVMIGMESDLAEERMAKLNHTLNEVFIEGVESPIAVKVSWGFRNFKTADDLETAISNADTAMYAKKKARKEARMRAYNIPLADPAFASGSGLSAS